MKLRSVGCTVALVAAAASCLVPPAHGGSFVLERGCDTLSTEPLRILLSFDLYNAYDFGDLCAIRIEPTDAYGVPINPILDCTAPSELVCATDSAGTTTFSANPCLPNDSWTWGVDSLGIVVAAPTGQFRAYLIIPGGVIRKRTLLQFSCAPGTPALRRSWGQLKAAYR